MAGPWENYAPPSDAPPPAPAGPWSNYQAPASPAEPPSQWDSFKRGLSVLIEDPSKLAEVGPGRIIGAVKGAATLPGDVAAGRVDPMSDEGIGRAAELGLLATPAPQGITTAGKVGIPRAVQNESSWASKVFGPSESAPMQITVRPSITEAAERVGVEVPRAVATDSRAIQAAGAGLRNVPLAGDPLMKSAERAIGQLGTAADTTAAGYSAANVAEAGEAARDALTVGWKGRTTANLEKLYGRVDEMVNPAVQTPLSSTQGVVSQILAERAAQRVSDPGKAVSFVTDAIQDSKGLTYDGVKGLRTRVGEMLKDKNALASAGVSQAELERVYGGLSDDLRQSVAASGGEKALAAFNSANSYAAGVKSRERGLQSIAGATSDEGVVERLAAAASSKGRADIDLLTKARRSIGSEAWDDVAGAVVGRLGRDIEGAFSPQRFLTDFGKLSPEGRAILFNSTGKGDLARSLTDIATVSSRFKELQKYANPSGTARNAFFGAGAAGALFAEPVTAISSILGANVAARVLAAPATASSMARWARAYEAAASAPSAATMAGFKIASRNLGVTLESKLAIPNPANDLFGIIGGGSRAAASGPQPQEPE